MTWNYRIVEYRDGKGFGLHEVYYDEDGEPATMTETPVGFVGESAEDVRDSVSMAGRAAGSPILKEPEEWPGLTGADDAAV